MSFTRLNITILLILLSPFATKAQVDSIIPSVQQVSSKYLNLVDNKIEKYSNRLTSKTEKTLTKLSRWEEKIHDILNKVSPATAAKLFQPGQPTFASLLQKLKDGEAIELHYTAQYEEYRDKLTTGIKYIATQKDKLDSSYIKKAKATVAKAKELDADIANSEATAKFIKERKRELIEQSIKYIGNSKYIQKISAENWYYVETLRNYKELFSDSKKTEQTAKDILNRIPAFQKYMQQNSMLASLFGSPSATGSTASLAGLQTRASVNALIQNQVAAGGSNAAAQVREQMQAAQAQLTQLKDKILKGGDNSSESELPPKGVNPEKTKTFKQRLSFGTSLQFAKSNSLTPGTADIGFSIGYRINPHGTLGVGVSYKMGMGTIQHIRITHEGIGLRSFIDWQLKKQFYISGGYELNHTASFEKFNQLKDFSAWQPSGLIGLSRKIKIKSKYFKGTQLSVLYDAFSYKHVPTTAPWLFRIGHNF